MSSLLLIGLGAGLAAAFAAWLLDHLLALITLGYTLPIVPRFLPVYLLTGLAAGLVMTLLLHFLNRFRSGAAATGKPLRLDRMGLALATLYAIPIFERVYQVLSSRVPAVGAGSLATLSLVGYAIWIGVLYRVTKTLFGAATLGAWTAAAGLAVNRNLVSRPLDREALIADAMILLGTFLCALLYRRYGARLGLGVPVCLLLGVSAWILVAPEPASDSPAGPIATAKPDLNLIIIDTLRWDVFLSVLAETPEGQVFKERLGAATWFDNAVSTAPWTAPSVGSILTGLYPQEHGFGAKDQSADPNRPLRRLSSSVPTLAMRLRNRGYRTEAIGTNPILHPVSGIDRGFERYELLGGPTTKLPLLSALSRTSLVRDEFYQPASAVRGMLRQRLQRLPEEKPLFLWLHLMDPHEPLHDHPKLPTDPGTEALTGKERLYREEVRYTLRELAGILETLDDHDRFQDAVTLILSDHGEMFPSDGHDTGAIDQRTGEPKLYGHGHALYHELVRIPMVIRPPGGLSTERRIGTLVSQIDLHDTIADLLGVDIPRIGRDRISLAPFLQETLPENLPRRPFALIGANQQGPKQRAIQTFDLKLIEFLRPVRPSELYDTLNDPREKTNIAEQEQNERLPLVSRLLQAELSKLEDQPEAEDMEIDAETRRQLEALGYL